VSDRYFAIASELPRNTVDVMISAMPRNGRSARAGAERLPVFASGAVSLVNLKAGSWGLENGPPRIESRIEYATNQTTNGQQRQEPKTGPLYARTRAAACRGSVRNAFNQAEAERWFNFLFKHHDFGR
jgi:hypothetical protein